MYSTALKYFKKYFEYCYSSELQAGLLREELEFEKYLTKSNHRIRGNIKGKPKTKPNYKRVKTQKVWIRNPKSSSDTVVNANYLCEFNNEYKYFISKYSKKNYVEAHHLISIQYQQQFKNSLDIHAIF